MKYLPIRNIEIHSKDGTDRLFSIKSGMEELIASSSDGYLRINDGTYTIPEINEFLDKLNEETIVYCEWIDQHTQLSTLLKGEIPSQSFQDTGKWLEHRFFSSFSAFLKNFLVSALLELRKKATFEENANLLSYCVLLPPDDRMFVEIELFKPLTERIHETRQTVEQAENETALSEAIQPFVNETATRMVNALSRSSYSTKLEYVNHLLWVVKQRGCTVRLANWILKQLEQIELNPEHRQKVADLKKDLREGRITVKNDNLAPSKGISLRSLAYLGPILLLIGISAWIIWEKPFSGPEDRPFDNKTAYQQFTKEERKRIDSLLREIQEEKDPSDNLIDPTQPILGNGVSVSIRIPFRNKRMEDLYKDLQLDVDLFDQGLNDSCSLYSEKEAKSIHYKYVLPLENRTASFQLMMKNESEYDVYMIVFEDETKGKIYSLLMGKGTQKTVNLEQYDRVLFIAGNELGKFIAPKGATSLPSKHFDHHFCQTDNNYSESISNLYSFERPQISSNKLLFSGDKSSWFTVVDLYSILEVQ